MDTTYNRHQNIRLIAGKITTHLKNDNQNEAIDDIVELANAISAQNVDAKDVDHRVDLVDVKLDHIVEILNNFRSLTAWLAGLIIACLGYLIKLQIGS